MGVLAMMVGRLPLADPTVLGLRCIYTHNSAEGLPEHFCAIRAKSSNPYCPLR